MAAIVRAPRLHPSAQRIAPHTPGTSPHLPLSLSPPCVVCVVVRGGAWWLRGATRACRSLHLRVWRSAPTTRRSPRRCGRPATWRSRCVRACAACAALSACVRACRRWRWRRRCVLQGRGWSAHTGCRLGWVEALLEGCAVVLLRCIWRWVAGGEGAGGRRGPWGEGAAGGELALCSCVQLWGMCVRRFVAYTAREWCGELWVLPVPLEPTRPSQL